jgi:hypothetical protein
MVGTIVLFILWVVSGWLFNMVARRFRREIDILKRENLTMAKAIVAHTNRLATIEEDARQTLEVALEYRNSLTSEPVKAKIETKPKGLNWKSFKSAIERANDPQEE